MPWPDGEPMIEEGDITTALQQGKKVLLVAHGKHARLRLSRIHPGAKVVEPMANLAGHRFDLVAYELPRFSRLAKLMAFADWVNMAVRPTMQPDSVEGDYAGVEP